MSCSKCDKQTFAKGLCRSHYDAARYRAPRISAAPLHDLIHRAARKMAAEMEHRGNAEQATLNVVAKRLKINGPVFRNLMAADYVLVSTADRICCQLGVHPMDIWGDEWLAA